MVEKLEIPFSSSNYGSFILGTFLMESSCEKIITPPGDIGELSM